MRAQLIGTWSWWRSLRLLLIAYTTLCAYGWLFSERQIFLPPEPTYSDQDFQIRKIPIGTEEITAFFLQNPKSDRVLLYSHGNASDLGTIRSIATVLQQSGYSVLAYDYRGYGLSDGERPSEKKVYQDIEAAYQYLTETLGITPDNIFVHGYSVGGGPSTYLAANYPVAGLILESTFVSAFRVVTRIPIVPFDKFPNLKRLGQIDVPILVIHGTTDGVVPFWHGEKLFESIQGQKRSLWIEGAGHNDLIPLAGDQYVDTLETFGDWVKSL